MGTLFVDSIGDMINGTLKQLGKPKFNQIAQKLQDYEVMGKLLKKDKVQFDSGTSITRRLMLNQSEQAKMTGLYESDQTNVQDVLAVMETPWKHTTTSYSFERREFLMNRNPSRIVDLVKVRRTDALLGLTELLEDQAMTAPASATDDKHVWGIPYWIVKNAVTGFTGAPAFGSTCGGINTTTYPNFMNYSAAYEDITKADLIKSMRTAIRKIGFKSPVDVNDFRNGSGDKCRIYVNETVLSGFEDLGEAQNENLGRDLASMDNTMTFRRNPIVWVPKLDADTENPVYMCNFQYMHPYVLSGDYLHEEKAVSASSHNVIEYFIDLTWNMICTNRRAQAVLYDPA